MTTRHKEVVIKVNAYVDEGIKDVVKALNNFDGWMTWDSCQGNPPDRPAVVEFCPGRVAGIKIPELEAFVRQFSERLVDGGCRNTKAELNRYFELSGYGWVHLSVPQDEIMLVADVLCNRRGYLDNKGHTHPTN